MPNLVRHALLVMLLPLLLVEGMGNGRVLCIDSDGSVTIESIQSPCCGRCCSKTWNGNEGSTAVAISDDDATDDCVDVPLPGKTILAAPVHVPSVCQTSAHAAIPEFAIPQSLSFLRGFICQDPAWHGGERCAGSARIAHLATIVIRC